MIGQNFLKFNLKNFFYLHSKFDMKIRKGIFSKVLRSAIHWESRIISPIAHLFLSKSKRH